MPKYSIITPLYNSFHLMNSFFDSLSNQSFKDFEVIIVDDCSSDGSWEKLNNYVQKSNLNIVVRQTTENSGPGVARNLGIEVAQGDWITYIDNDDFVDSNFLERIDGVINTYDINCIICDYYTWTEGKTEIFHSMYIAEPGMKTISDCIKSLRNHTFCKFYKRSKCKDVRFPKVRRCEDVAYVCQAVIACGNAYYLKEPLYYYCQRPTSLSNNKKMDHSGMVNAFSIIEEKYKNIYPLEIKNKSVTDILYGGVLMMCKSGKDNSFISTYISDYEKKYPNWWKCEIVKYVGKPKKLFLLCVRLHFIPGLKLISYLHSRIIDKAS